mmetsp:Transcript_20020/g.49187  ORF Transcript_20020/g.49187 Transcript_20020/m.49187 type:complete len:422 (+) Transcript_20020:42-1307(+)
MGNPFFLGCQFSQDPPKIWVFPSTRTQPPTSNEQSSPITHMVFVRPMDVEIKELITDYLECQVANHGKGKGVLAAWKEVFAPKSIRIHSRTSKYVVIRKSEQMKSLALFFDKGDAFTCVPSGEDCETDSTSVNKEFSSFFEAVMYLAAHSSKLTRHPTHDPTLEGMLNLHDAKEELEENNNPAKVGAPSNKAIMKAAVQTYNEACADNEKKRDPTLGSSAVAENSLQPSTKKLKFEYVVTDSVSLETPEDFPDHDGNKQGSHPNYRLKAALWDQRFQELAALWDGETTVYQNHISPNRSLTNWVKHQRKCFKRGLVSEERMSKLESIGFKWVGRNSVVLSKQPQDEWELAAAKQAFSVNAARQKQLSDDRNDVWSALWDTRFKELVEYKKRFGDTKVPKEWPENKKIGWVGSETERAGRRS